MTHARSLHLRRVRTPIGRYGGALAKVRTDDLAAVPIKALMSAQSEARLGRSSTRSIFGCANQAGEDNRNVARMALLLAGLPDTMPGITVNRLCASGLDAVGAAARAIRAGEIDFAIAGGVESMTRAPLRHGQGAGGVPAQRRDPRHHHRLALRQSADEAAVRRRFDAGDRRERRRGIPGGARGPGRLRAARRSSAPPRRRPRASSPARSRRSRCRAARPARSWSTRTSIRAPTRRSKALAKLKPFVRSRRHRHGRQRVRRQRRRRRADHRLGSGREGARPARPIARILGMASRRRAAAHHGHRPGAGDAQADGAARAARSATST